MTDTSPPPRRAQRHIPGRLRTQLGILVALCATVFALTAASCTPPAKATLSPGETLAAGAQLQSSNGMRAAMQGDGNFVVYNASNTPLWYTNTAGHPGSHITLQTDGNLVLYDANHVARWSSKTASTESVPAILTMQTDGNLVLRATNVPLWSSEGGAANCYGSGCAVLSSYETHQHGSVAGRDCGYSEPLGASGQSFWLFCDTPITNPSGQSSFIVGSTAARGAAYPSIAPQAMTELPNGTPTKTLPQPTGLTRQNGTACGTPGSFAASWASGTALIPGTSDQVLIPFGNMCVDNGTMNYFGNGIAEYNTTSKAVTYYGQNLFPGTSATNNLGSPVYDSATNALYFYVQNCTSAYGACTASKTFIARVNLGSNPLTTRPWRTASNYAFYKGGATWSAGTAGAVSITPTNQPGLTAQVKKVPALGNQWVMVLQEGVGNTYRILTASSPAGPWTAHKYGALNNCASVPSGTWCYAYNVHPELSTSTKLAITVYNPKFKHVTLEMIPW